MTERKHRNRELWQQRMAEYENSGKRIKDWCQESGCTIDAFKYWRYRVRIQEPNQLQPARQTQTGWVQMKLSSPEEAACYQTINIKIGAAKIEVVNGIDSDLLRQIVEAKS